MEKRNLPTLNALIQDVNQSSTFQFIWRITSKKRIKRYILRWHAISAPKSSTQSPQWFNIWKSTILQLKSKCVNISHSSKYNIDFLFRVKCPDCPLTFISRQYLKYHTVCHLEELPYLCEAGCGARFKRKNAFHSTPVKSECSYCGKIFTHICLLRFHVKSTHLDYLKCQQCGSFLSKTSMSGHLAYHRDQARTKRHYQSYKIQEENKKRDETIEFLKCEVL